MTKFQKNLSVSDVLSLWLFIKFMNNIKTSNDKTNPLRH